MLRSRLLGTAICVAFIAALLIAPIVATAQTGIEVPEMAACELYITGPHRTWTVSSRRGSGYTLGGYHAAVNHNRAAGTPGREGSER